MLGCIITEQGFTDTQKYDNHLFIVFWQPPKIRSFINGVVGTPLENIEEPLKGFVWEFEKVLLLPVLESVSKAASLRFD